MSVLEVKNAGVNFVSGATNFGFSTGKKTFWALKDVSFSLEKGDVVGVIGRNGAGKSTLMSLVSGIIDPDKGSVKRNFNNALLLSLQAGFMPYLSGRKNIYLSGLLLGYSFKELKALENDIINFSGIKDFIDKPVATYSSGMKTRLGFSICIYLEPELILIDEVLGVGDREFKDKSKKALRSKIETATAVIVSHDERTLSDLCNKLVVINKGKSQEFSDVGEGLSYYKTVI